MDVGHVFTDARHGDLAVSGDAGVLEARRRAVVDRPWTWLRQVHGARVVTVTRPGEHAGVEADAAVTEVPGAALAVHTADCGPVLLVADGAVGVVHAGWRGLVEGVVEATAERVVALGGPLRRAELGPHVHAHHYEFGAAELDLVAAAYGPSVRAVTDGGRPALDLAAAIGEACRRQGVPLSAVGRCPACADDLWSHRARRDTARQALVAWIES